MDRQRRQDDREFQDRRAARAEAELAKYERELAEDTEGFVPTNVHRSPKYSDTEAMAKISDDASRARRERGAQLRAERTNELLRQARIGNRAREEEMPSRAGRPDIAWPGLRYDPPAERAPPMDRWPWEGQPCEPRVYVETEEARRQREAKNSAFVPTERMAMFAHKDAFQALKDERSRRRREADERERAETDAYENATSSRLWRRRYE